MFDFLLRHKLGAAMYFAAATVASVIWSIDYRMNSDLAMGLFMLFNAATSASATVYFGIHAIAATISEAQVPATSEQKD